MSAVLAVAIVTSPAWLLLPIAAMGEHVPTVGRMFDALGRALFGTKES